MKDDLQQHVWSHIETLEPRHRLVMLGASNLSRSFPIAVSLALNAIEGPLEILVAKGHGRSYGKESKIFSKKFLGISQCGIWKALDVKNPASMTAWVTDIGNDLAYGVSVATIIGWVTECVDRLLSHDARVVISDLPLGPLRALGAARYRVLRSVFFPTCHLDWAEMLSRIELLSRRLWDLANSRKTTVFIGRNEWYGWDPIHPHRVHLAAQWRDLFQVANLFVSRSPCTKNSLLLRSYLRGLRLEVSKSFSIERRTQQPDGLLCDGTSIALY